MRIASAMLLCVLPLHAGCLRDSQAEAGGQGAQDLTRFEAVVRQTARARAHTAVALAAGSDRLGWGAAVAASTPARARALALARCAAHARQNHIDAPCGVYAVDGRPLYLERS